MSTAKNKDKAWIYGLFAHRGLHNAANGVVENSKTAFFHAVQNQLGIEADVQFTKDHRPIVFHDATLQRLTGGQGAVINHNRDDLLKLPLTGSQDHICSLQELLAMTRKKGTPLLLEIKTNWTLIPETALDNLIHELVPHQAPIAIMSFDGMFIQRMRKKLANHLYGLIVSSHYRPSFAPSKGPTDYQRKVAALSGPGGIVPLQPDFLACDIQDFDVDYLLPFKDNPNMPIAHWTIKKSDQFKIAKADNRGIIFEGADIAKDLKLNPFGLSSL